MTAKRRGLTAWEELRREQVWQAADEIRGEGVERVALRNVRARMKRRFGVAGNNQCVGEYLSWWMEERAYSPIIELAKMPEAMQTSLARAGLDPWAAAQSEAAAIYESERVRAREAVQAQAALRDEAMMALDARETEAEMLRKDVDRLEAEVERMREHLGRVRAIAFWRRVAEEIWEVLPEREGMHLDDIAQRIGNETIKEAEDHPGEWGPELLRGVIDQRIKFSKLFAKDRVGRYRRRRPEDAAA